MGVGGPGLQPKTEGGVKVYFVSQGGGIEWGLFQGTFF